ncbi:PaaI family thioesterase [Mycobacterium avium subsp. hominissuis]|uniref:PaaI family thioesterase n=1 Tax=Mycobacterium avium TaxID=1764 RepID=UPI001CCA1D68|nr:PaaI family thioesterase [Mycobacterium avium]MBZ4546648.1 PaaI family thioesterase [Mycobacterium avium subsp. hominissuis]
MTGVDEREVQHDIETPAPVQIRFGIDFVAASLADATVVMSMPMLGLRNPFTGAPAVGPLAILVDAAAGMVNHYRRQRDRWTVSSELSLEVSANVNDAMADGAPPVVASARAVGSVGATPLALCTLMCGETEIGIGTVRSAFIPADGVTAKQPPRTLLRGTPTLGERMAVQVDTGQHGAIVLRQHPDPDLNNDIGIVHGGMASAGLELAASAAMNADRSGDRFQTASLRVNFLRPFFAGGTSSYVATPVRVGRTTGVADAQAIGDDGRVALTARVTAYR